MRRRIRSAALPLHRHSLAQLAVDGALVALAYWLAFQLRFTNGPSGYYAHLRDRTIWWVAAGTLPVLLAARVYQRSWRYSGQRDYEAVLRGVVAIVALTVVAVAVIRPVEHATSHGTSAIGLPNGVVVLFGLLSLAFLVGVRALARSFYERRPVAAFRGGRKGQRSVLIAGAGEGGRLVVRETLQMELARVGDYLSGQIVLVTGAGGSIGSELCRQIARVEPRRIVLLDQAEDNLFAIQRELEDERHVAPSMLSAVLADCKEEERMREVFTAHRPTVVFHAAAYKHVGLMEVNPVEAVRNNAIATRVVAHVAGQLGVQCFVLVSTDKAVAPATVMGASKALAEFALEGATARYPDTRYAAVRFGNVLGSSGSVVPIFRRQIERGGPITVTDERMTRYFMTIPEAVQLIIRSGPLACAGGLATSSGTDGGTPRAALGALANLRPATPSRPSGPAPAAAEVYVLDMGEPVSILELAREMIELSGLDPDRDIEIEIVGRRPGEKLHEELFNSYERPRPTSAEKILLAEREPLGAKAAESMFSEIGLLVLEGDAAGLAAKVSELSALHLEAQSNGGRRRTTRLPDRLDGGAEPALDAPAALLHSPDS